MSTKIDELERKISLSPHLVWAKVKDLVGVNANQLYYEETATIQEIIDGLGISLSVIGNKWLVIETILAELEINGYL